MAYKYPSKRHSKVEPAPDSFSTKCATRFMHALQRHGVMKRPAALSSWAKEFDRLIKEDSQEAIAKVLDWYIAHLKDDYTPEAVTARGFYDKYWSIHRAYELDPTSCEPSEDARKIAGYVRHDTQWPRRIRMVLPHIIQKSIDNYEPLYRRVKELEKRYTAHLNKRDKDGYRWSGGSGDENPNLLVYFLDCGFFRKPRDFVWLVWMPLLWREHHRHPGRCPIRYMVWSMHRKLWHEEARDLADEFAEGQEWRWDKLLKSLNPPKVAA